MGLWGAIKSGAKKAFVAIKKIVQGAWSSVKNALTAAQQIFQNFLHRARDFLRVVIQKVQVKIAGTLMGAAHILRRVGDKCLELSENFSVDPELGTWKVTTVKRVIGDESQLPLEVREKLAREGEVNNTKELDAALVC